MRKQCRRCHKRKFRKFFSAITEKSSRLREICDRCICDGGPRKKLTPAEARERNLRYFYDITGVKWKAQFLKQGKRCAICRRKKPDSKKGWVTDHSHKTRKFRGILCLHCNTLLGFCLESIAILKATIHYLRRHRCAS